MIVTTHRLDEAQRLCDRFGLMHRGRFVLEGTLEELRQKSGRETLVDMFMEMTGQRQGAGLSPTLTGSSTGSATAGTPSADTRTAEGSSS